MPHLEVIGRDRSTETIPAPRGPIVNAAWIIRHYHTDPDTGTATVSDKWIRETVPGKIRLSHSRVGWYRDDVIKYYEGLRRAG